MYERGTEVTLDVGQLVNLTAEGGRLWGFLVVCGSVSDVCTMSKFFFILRVIIEGCKNSRF